MERVFGGISFFRKVAVFLLVASLAVAPVAAQQVTGELGSPSLTTTVNGKQIPPPPPQLGGVIKQSAQYSWIETRQLTLKGDEKPLSQERCQYGPDGQVQKTPISPPPPPSGGRIKKRIIEKKTEEMKDYLNDVKGLLGMYVPPDPQKMEQAYRAGNFSLNPVGGIANFIFKDYAQRGDQMILSFGPAKYRQKTPVAQVQFGCRAKTPNKTLILRCRET
jgi:hypothetical protein